MVKNIWMRMFWADYFKDTVDITVAEHGVYLLLIGYYWEANGVLTSDVNRLKLILRLTDGDMVALNYVLNRYFEIVDNKLTHKRIDKELAEAMKFRQAQSENGKKGGRPQKNNPENNPRVNPNDNPNKSHGFSMDKPTPNPNESQSQSQSQLKSESKLNTHLDNIGASKIKKVRSVFSKPTIDDISTYFSEYAFSQNIQVDLLTEPNRMFDYYEANGWKVGRNPMKDWKATCRTWLANQRGRFNQGKNYPPAKKNMTLAEMEADLTARVKKRMENQSGEVDQSNIIDV